MRFWLTFAPEAAAEAAEHHAPGPKAELILSILGVPVSNTVLSAWIAMAVILAFAYFSTRRLSIERPGTLQNVAELIVEIWLGLIDQVAGPRGRRFFPLVVTSFVFILFSNWIGIFPGFGETLWLRSANSDLNLTAAMAVAVFFAIQLYALKAGPWMRLREFLWPPGLGQLHILTELVRPVSLSLRLFCNILAGEVLLATLLALAPPVVFALLGLELFVGFIQALIFSMLTLVFLAIAVMHEHEHVQHEPS